MLVGAEPYTDGSGLPRLLVSHIADSSVPASFMLECSVPSHPNPGFDPTSLHDDDSACRDLVVAWHWKISRHVPPISKA